MNPFFERKLFLVRYIALYTLFAAVYAAVFGVMAQMPAGFIVLDGFVIAMVSGFEGLMLWNVLKYGMSGITGAPLKMLYYLTVGVLFVGVAAGIESAVIYWTDRTQFPNFTETIPARILCLALAYALFVLYYTYAGRCDESADMASLPEPVIPSDDTIERITVRSGSKISIINAGEIIYLQAEGDYVGIVTAEGRWLKEQTMKYFEENLPRENFVRVHRSYIVSVPHISRIEQSGREQRVVLRDGTNIRISDSGYKSLKQRLGL